MRTYFRDRLVSKTAANCIEQIALQSCGRQPSDDETVALCIKSVNDKFPSTVRELGNERIEMLCREVVHKRQQ